MKSLILTKLISCCLLAIAVNNVQADMQANLGHPSQETLLTQPQVRCHPRLFRFLKAIQALDEGKQLLDKILAEGTITIQLADNYVTNQFAACWSCENRTIVIGLAASPSEGEILSSLIFELHNALMTSHLDEIDLKAMQGKTDREKYVRAVELIEYGNSIAASNIAKAGVERGLFPTNTYLHVYNDFDEYFYYQKLSGHSDIIGKNYDMLGRHGNMPIRG